MVTPQENPQRRVLRWETALVWANLMVSLWALAPFLIRYLLILGVAVFACFQTVGGFFGRVAVFGMLLTMFALALPEEIGRVGLVVCAPVFISASILIPALLVNRNTSWTIKLLTLAVEVTALCLMYSKVTALHEQYLHGAFRGLF
jgi:glucan phosphoethanolaminetransferase (alkaline phosphatase superfamily)